MKKKQDPIQTVQDPIVSYGMPYQTPLLAVIGNQFVNATDFDLLNFARKGVSKKSLLALAKQISFTLEELAAVLHISERTLQRYTPNTLVKTEHADRAIELARLYERGAEVLVSSQLFNLWMRTPNRALHNEIPLNLLDTSIGFDLIIQVLGRLEYGVFS